MIIKDCVFEGKRYLSPYGSVAPAAGLPDISRYGNGGVFTDIAWAQLPSGVWVMPFDGLTSAVDFGAHIEHRIQGTQFSVECWVKLDSLTPANHYLVSKEGPLLASEYEWGLYLSDTDSDDRFHLWFNLTSDGNGGNNATRQFANALDVIIDTLPHHLVVTLDLALVTTEIVKFFVDGIQRPTVLGAGNWQTACYQGGSDLRFGESERLTGVNWTLLGKMPAPRLYSYALNPDQINARYASKRYLFDGA